MQDPAAAHTDDPGSELENIIRDFAACLENRKKQGLRFLPVSESSLALMASWGKERPARAAAVECQGPASADIFLLDSENMFFKGEAGQLLVKILKAMHLSPDQVMICGMGDPREIHKKIHKAAPRVIIPFGEKAARALLDSNEKISTLRGRFHSLGSIRVMPTFHPAQLLKAPGLKRDVWEDMKQVMAFAGLNNGG